jgi:hypothetical protein
MCKGTRFAVDVGSPKSRWAIAAFVFEGSERGAGGSAHGFGMAVNLIRQRFETA